MKLHKSKQTGKTIGDFFFVDLIGKIPFTEAYRENWIFPKTSTSDYHNKYQRFLFDIIETPLIDDCYYPEEEQLIEVLNPVLVALFYDIMHCLVISTRSLLMSANWSLSGNRLCAALMR